MRWKAVADFEWPLTAAPPTHELQLRCRDNAGESPADQPLIGRRRLNQDIPVSFPSAKERGQSF